MWTTGHIPSGPSRPQLTLGGRGSGGRVRHPIGFVRSPCRHVTEDDSDPELALDPAWTVYECVLAAGV